MMLPDGMHSALPRMQYDSVTGRVNFSRAKLMALSPAHYRAALIRPPEDTEPRKFGRVLHIAVLEPERFQGAIAVWDGGRRAGKDWEAYKKQHAGTHEIITMEEYDRVREIQNAVRSEAMARPYLERGKGELTMAWSVKLPNDFPPMPLKGRVDFSAEGVGALVDLKSCVSAKPEWFGRSAASLYYHVQAAWYVDGYEILTGKRLPYIIVAVEKTFPYAVQVFNVPEPLLQLGRQIYQGWLNTLQACDATSYWPGYAVGPVDLELPAWALPPEDDWGLD